MQAGLSEIIFSTTSPDITPSEGAKRRKLGPGAAPASDAAASSRHAPSPLSVEGESRATGEEEQFEVSHDGDASPLPASDAHQDSTRDDQPLVWNKAFHYSQVTQN
jgi:hypothetical protein